MRRVGASSQLKMFLTIRRPSEIILCNTQISLDNGPDLPAPTSAGTMPLPQIAERTAADIRAQQKQAEGQQSAGPNLCPSCTNINQGDNRMIRTPHRRPHDAKPSTIGGIGAPICSGWMWRKSGRSADPGIDRHRRLDEAVFDAYGWPPDISDDDLLARLLERNLAIAQTEQAAT